jgi:hypothetical protein
MSDRPAKRVAPYVYVGLAACRGADTDSVREGCEHMERCRLCEMMVREDLVGHPFFGFKASCDRESKPPDQDPTNGLEADL